MKEDSLEKRALTDIEAAKYIGMSESFLRQCRVIKNNKRGYAGPRFIKIGRAVRYLKDDLDMWLENNRI